MIELIAISGNCDFFATALYGAKFRNGSVGQAISQDLHSVQVDLSTCGI